MNSITWIQVDQERFKQEDEVDHEEPIYKVDQVGAIILNPIPYGLFNQPKVMGGQICPP